MKAAVIITMTVLGCGLSLYGSQGKSVTYRPECTFFGYRYLSLSASDKVVMKSIGSIPVSSIAQNLETGRITTGNDDINKLISNTLWGMRSNYLSEYVSGTFTVSKTLKD